jgi:hypothetical protein
MIVALVVEGTCTESCVQSLISGNTPPDEIYVDVSTGSVLQYFMRTYPAHPESHSDSHSHSHSHKDTYALLVSGSCVYPPQLVSEYLEALKEVVVSGAKGVAYGLGGIVMSVDKQHNIEREFQSLLAGTATATDIACDRTVIGYCKGTAQVDYLEIPHTILVARSCLDDGLFKYLEAVPMEPEADREGLALESTCVLLSNYFASRGVARIQVCNLILNRFMLTQSRCVPDPSKIQGQIFIETSTGLRAQRMLHI